MSKFNPFFVNTNLCLEEKDVKNINSFKSAIVNNTGNSYIAYAMIKLLYGGLIKPNEIKNIYQYDFSKSDKEIDFINNSCSHVIFILQDQIRVEESYGLELPFEKLTEFFKKIKKPLLITSLGANAFHGQENKLHKQLSRERIDFFKFLSDKTEVMGVRGNYTVEVLRKLGIKNAEAVGCPSFFESGKNRIIKKTPFSEDLKVAFSGTFFACNIKNKTYILQDEMELIDFLYFNRTRTDFPYRVDYKELSKNNYRAFSDIEGWKNHLRKFDFMFGHRVHGAIASLNAGTPAVIINPDMRAKEMTDLFKVPYMPELANTKINIKEVYEKANYTEMNKIYNTLYDNYIAWLLKNGIDMQKTKPQDVSYIKQPELKLNKISEDIFPKFSILLTTYNRHKMFEGCLQSILNQTYNNFEVIVCDRGSTPSVEPIIKKYNDPRVRYFKSSQEINANDSGNEIVKQIKGDYFVFIADDDAWVPSTLEKVKNAFDKDEKYGIVQVGLTPYRQGYEHQVISKKGRNCMVYKEFSKKSETDFLEISGKDISENFFSSFGIGDKQVPDILSAFHSSAFFMRKSEIDKVFDKQGGLYVRSFGDVGYFGVAYDTMVGYVNLPLAIIGVEHNREVEHQHKSTRKWKKEKKYIEHSPLKIASFLNLSTDAALKVIYRNGIDKHYKTYLRPDFFKQQFEVTINGPVDITFFSEVLNLIPHIRKIYKEDPEFVKSLTKRWTKRFLKNMERHVLKPVLYKLGLRKRKIKVLPSGFLADIPFPNAMSFKDIVQFSKWIQTEMIEKKLYM